MSQRPVAVGLLLCEQVVVEEKTRNATLVNCFTRRTVEQLPSEPISFVVFAILTDGQGEVQLEVVVQRLDTLEEISHRTLSFRFADPLKEARCLFRLRDCSFPVAGYYQVTLLADGESVAQRRFQITLKDN